MDKYSWGFRREAVFADFLSTGDLIAQLVITVRCLLERDREGERGGGGRSENEGEVKEGIWSS